MGSQYNNTHTTDPSEVVPVEGVTSNVDQLQNDSVCRMGYGTWLASGQVQGRTCGQITVVDVTNLSCSPDGSTCYHIQHTNQVTFDSTGGDSGGAVTHKVYINGSEFYYVAYGTHVHSQPDGPGAIGWYSPVTLSASAYSLAYGYSFNVCYYPTC
jgi:hypothetical protein